VGTTGKTFTVGGEKATDKSGLAGVAHGSISQVSMYVGDNLINNMSVLSNKQEISDVCFVDVKDKKKCLFNSNNAKGQNIDNKYKVTFTNSKQNGALIQGMDTRYITMGQGKFLSGLRPWYIV